MNGTHAIAALLLCTSSVAFAEDDAPPPDVDVSNDDAGVLARSGRFGLGLGASSLANGITGKLYFSENIAGQVNVGWWLRAGASVSADLLYERAFYKSEDLSIQGYLGAGPSVGVFTIGTSATVIGVQGVVGAGLQIAEVPIEITTEIRPQVLIGNQFWSGFYFGGGGAIRYYF